jgi:hypothetical protein
MMVIMSTADPASEAPREPGGDTSERNRHVQVAQHVLIARGILAVAVGIVTLAWPSVTRQPYPGAAFPVAVTQRRCLKTVDIRGFPEEGEFLSGRVPCWLCAPIPSCPELGV